MRTARSGSTNTSVASSTTEGLLVGSHSARIGASIFNDSTANLFVLCSTGTASATKKTAKIAPGQYFETPYGYTGPIRGVWDAANGAANVTEYLI